MKLQYQNISKIVVVLFTLFLVAGTGEVFAGNGPVVYEVTIENLTSNQPFTPAVVATHKGDVRMFKVGKAASFELKEIAENGNLTPMFDALSSNSRVSEVMRAFGPSGPILPSETATVEITAEQGVNFLSLASMLICTNDGFSGLDKVKLPNKGTKVVYGQGYDAGTEINTEDFADIVPPCQLLGGVSSEDGGTGMSNPSLAENGVITHHSGIQEVAEGDLTQIAHGWDVNAPTVKVTITRISQ